MLEPLGALFADAGPRARAGRRAGARRDARPRRTTTSTSPPRRGPTRPSAAERLGRRDLGHGPRLRHHRLPARATGRSRSRRTGPRATTPTSRKPAVDFGDTLAGDLGRRDFTVNAMAVLAAGPRVRRPVRRRGRPRAPRAAHARPARGLLLRRPAADDAGGPVRRPARLHRRPRGGRGDDARWPTGSRSSRPSGSATSWSSWCCAPYPRLGLTLLVETGPGRPGAARAAGAGARARRAPPAQGRLRAHPDRARAGDRPGGPAARRRPRLRLPVRGADARRRQAAHPPVPRRRHRSPSTTTTWSAPS